VEVSRVKSSSSIPQAAVTKHPTPDPAAAKRRNSLLDNSYDGTYLLWWWIMMVIDFTILTFQKEGELTCKSSGLTKYPRSFYPFNWFDEKSHPRTNQGT
jgi:hypothetical protein